MSKEQVSPQEELHATANTAADDSRKQGEQPDTVPMNAADDLAAALADADAARQVTDISTELAEAKAQALRAQAELENFRKRMRREMELEQKYAALPVVSDLLPVLDNLQRAIAAAGSNEAAAGVVDGIKIVAGMLTSILQKHHCEVLDPAGEVFDPNVHEAIAQQPSDTQEPGTVLFVAQVGYKIHDRVVRPAQVVVVAGQPDEAAPPAGDEAAQS